MAVQQSPEGGERVKLHFRRREKQVVRPQCLPGLAKEQRRSEGGRNWVGRGRRSNGGGPRVMRGQTEPGSGQLEDFSE